MADLGVLPTVVLGSTHGMQTGAGAAPSLPVQATLRQSFVGCVGIPLYAGAYSTSYPYPCAYELRGQVTAVSGGSTVPVPGARVTLFVRKLRKPIDEKVADDSGNFAFTELANIPGGYFAVAFFPDGTPVQNALVFDQLTPAAS